MKLVKKIFCLGLLAAAFASCQKAEIETPIFTPEEESEEEELLKPDECKNKVVAHRCGGSEAGAPENSLAALKYTVGLKCLAAECDIYYTKDNNVIVHHGSNGIVNGLHPSRHTLSEIRAAGKLANGENIPTLQDFLKVVCVKGNCTKLWIETKNITNNELSASEQENAIINGFTRAMEIIADMKAQNFVEFNGTGRSAVFKKIYPQATAKGFTMSIATTTTAGDMKSRNYSWANYDISGKSDSDIIKTVSEYKDKGVELSLYCLDTDAQRNLGKQVKDDVKGLLTNYPSKLLKKAF